MTRKKKVEMEKAKVEEQPELEDSVQDFIRTQEEAFALFLDRNALYGDAFLKMGYLGAFYEAFGCISKLRTLTLEKEYTQDNLEAIRDTLLDLMNFTTFAHMMIVSNNISGEW